jgi:hypothetical protein
MVGPASSGKTTLARLFGETVGLPFVEVPPRGVRDSWEFYQHIAVTLERTVVMLPDGPMSCKMVKPGLHENDPTMTIPPCVVFVDEVHGLPTNLREVLLKAVESKDRLLCIEDGRYADCRNVCWIVATTERGRLFGPFDSRFTKVELEMYGTEEIARIVRLDNPDWDVETSLLAARYCPRVPRDRRTVDEAEGQPEEVPLRQSGYRAGHRTGKARTGRWVGRDEQGTAGSSGTWPVRAPGSSQTNHFLPQHPPRSVELYREKTGHPAKPRTDNLFRCFPGPGSIRAARQWLRSRLLFLPPAMPSLYIPSLFQQRKRKYGRRLARARQELARFLDAFEAEVGREAAGVLRAYAALSWGPRSTAEGLPESPPTVFDEARRLKREVTALSRRLHSPRCCYRERRQPPYVLWHYGVTWDDLGRLAEDGGRVGGGGEVRDRVSVDMGW